MPLLNIEIFLTVPISVTEGNRARLDLAFHDQRGDQGSASTRTQHYLRKCRVATKKELCHYPGGSVQLSKEQDDVNPCAYISNDLAP